VLTTQHPLSTKLVLTSPTSGGSSVGILCLRTKATELVRVPGYRGLGSIPGDTRFSENTKQHKFVFVGQE
jgi:hypothetical protein